MRKILIAIFAIVVGIMLIKAGFLQFDKPVKIDKTIRCSDGTVEWLLQVYSDGEVSIQPIGNVPKNIVIPEKLEDYTITQIASYAFSGYPDLRTIECPATITYVGDYAFAGCDKLVSVVYASEDVEFGEGIQYK